MPAADAIVAPSAVVLTKLRRFIFSDIVFLLWDYIGLAFNPSIRRIIAHFDMLGKIVSRSANSFGVVTVLQT